MAQIFQHVFIIRSNETAHGSQGLAESAHDEVHLAGDPEVSHGPPSSGTHDSQTVGIIQVDEQVRKFLF